MTILVTGAAGFIGSALCAKLLARGDHVVGIDNLNDYYDVSLKKARLAQLDSQPKFKLYKIDISDPLAMAEFATSHGDVTRIVHLAAQAGVRYSLEHPRTYIDSNIRGFLEIIELARRLPKIEHLVYASSSSVYGANTKLPFAVEDRVDTPVSLYAATKRANEMMGYCYSHLFRIPMTGLRFFTVYGPWGRPDMSAYIFTRAILSGDPIRVFNDGKMRRDFTYIDDIVSGVLACLDKAPDTVDGQPPHRVYNIGNNNSEELMRFISVIEEACGRKAQINFEPIQPGDVVETYADIEATKRDFGFQPSTGIDVGVPRFVDWYRAYHKV